MAERKVGSEIVNLTPKHYESRIALIYVNSRGMPHIIRNLLTKATNFL
jgi:hypothetical protein